MSLPADEGDVVAQFIDAMRSCGVSGDMSGGHPIADGKMHRVKSLTNKNAKNLNVWYVLHLDDPASGAFGDWSTGVNETWTLQKANTYTPQQRERLRERMEEAARQREADRARLGNEAAAAAKRIMDSTVKADPKHAYLDRKGLKPFPGLRQLSADVNYTIDGERKVAREGWLVVPIYTAAGELASVQTIRADGTKSYIKGSIKAGRYHPIGKATSLIFIGEGYATLARVHGATGNLSVVAFDSGNLKPVAVEISKKYPNAQIVIVADNDRFVTKPVENPGLVKAKEAALAVRAKVAVPHFGDGDTGTDFDDLAQTAGIEAVRAGLDAAVPPKDAKAYPPKPEPQPEPEGRAPYHDDAPPIDHIPDDGEPDYSTPRPPSDRGGGKERNPMLASFGAPHFRCLGVDETTCFYQPSNVSQVISLAASAHKAENLMRLAPLQWWESEFPGKSKDGGVDWKAAVNACMQACMYRKKFVPHNAIRGRGAWFESSRPVFHAGDHLVVDGHPTAIHDHPSGRFVYDEGDGIEVDIGAPASTEEAQRFLDLCKSLRWASPLSGYLLAGWCTVAPVCGFLAWRPHIWINGPAGSGKSTVIRDIVKRCLSDTAINVVGMTSEAGIRAALGMDALPVVFDEAEPKDMASQTRIRSILDLARVAASESDGLILKGTSNQKAKGFRARSMFAFASIDTQIEGYADETRFTQLSLRAPDARTDEEAAAAKKHYEKFVSDIFEVMTPEFPRRLLARTILNLAALRANVEVFTAAATIHLGAQRLGDQIGPMLAGAFLLNSTKTITVEVALDWIKKNDWIQHSAKEAARDIDRFIQHLTGFMVRNQTPEGGTWERPIGELIEIVMRESDKVTERSEHGDMIRVENKNKAAAVKALGRLGFRVWRSSDGYLVDISTTFEGLKSRVLRGTSWQGTNLRQLFQNLEGVIPGKGNRYFSSGVNTPFVTVPASALLRSTEPDLEADAY